MPKKPVSKEARQRQKKAAKKVEELVARGYRLTTDPTRTSKVYQNALRKAKAKKGSGHR